MKIDRYINSLDNRYFKGYFNSLLWRDIRQERLHSNLKDIEYRVIQKLNKKHE